MSLTKKIISLLIFNILAFGASAWGSFVTNLYKEPWYSEIAKSSFTPPDWVFAPVWIILYIAMSVAIWLIWINPKRVEKIIYIYFIHLLINGSWSIFFFRTSPNTCIFNNNWDYYFFRCLVNQIILPN